MISTKYDSTCMGRINNLRVTIETCNEIQESLYLVFETTFDILSHEDFKSSRRKIIVT